MSTMVFGYQSRIVSVEFVRNGP